MPRQSRLSEVSTVPQDTLSHLVGFGGGHRTGHSRGSLFPAVVRGGPHFAGVTFSRPPHHARSSTPRARRVRRNRGRNILT